MDDPNDAAKRRRRDASRRGGLKGGKVRAARLSAKRRSEIARKAARARWARERDPASSTGSRRSRSGPAREGLREPWRLNREGPTIDVTVSAPLDVDGWESMFDAIAAERDRGGDIVVLPVEIPSEARPGDLFHEMLRKNLRERGLTLAGPSR